MLREGCGGGSDLPEERWIRNGPLTFTNLSCPAALMLNKPAERIEFCSVGRIVKCKDNFQIYSDRLFSCNYSQLKSSNKDRYGEGRGGRERKYTRVLGAGLEQALFRH